MVLIAFVLLVGCSQEEENCLDSFCVDSLEYGIEGTLSVEDIDRGTVEFQLLIL